MTGKSSYSGYATLKVFGVTDMVNNIEDFTIKNKIYIDTNAPGIRTVNISGGGASKETSLRYINSDEKDITIEMITGEKLGKAPTVQIGNASFRSLFDKQIKDGSNNLYIYKLTIPCSEIIRRKAVSQNSVAQIIIKDYEDLAGNKGKIRTFNNKNKSSNDKYLYYGSIENGKLYFAGTGNVEQARDEDINKDGFITDFDYALSLKHAVGIKVKGEEKYQFVDLNNDKKYNSADSVEVEKAVISAETENIIKEGKETVLKVYDKNLNEIKNANIYIYKNEEKESNRIYRSDVDITVRTDDNSIKVNVKNSTKIEKIIVKAVYQQDGKGDKSVGEIVLDVQK